MPAGIHEDLPTGGGRIQRDVLANINLPSIDPTYAKDPKTAAATITSVFPCADPLTLVCTMPDAAKGTSVVFTAPTGTTWELIDAAALCTTNTASGTYQPACNSLATCTAITCAVAGVTTRSSAGWSVTNAQVGAGETVALIATSGTANQAPAVVTLTLIRKS